VISFCFHDSTWAGQGQARHVLLYRALWAIIGFMRDIFGRIERNLRDTFFEAWSRVLQKKMEKDAA
jgi:hypothetical protein